MSLLSPRLGKPQISILQDAPPALRCFGGGLGLRHGAPVSRRWGPHKHFLSVKPRGVGAKGRLAGESRGTLQSPLAFPPLPGSSANFYGAGSWRGPSAAWRWLTFLSFPEKGAPSGAAGGRLC
jgi:hypothetical protein